MPYGTVARRRLIAWAPRLCAIRVLVVRAVRQNRTRIRHARDNPSSRRRVVMNREERTQLRQPRIRISQRGRIGGCQLRHAEGFRGRTSIDFWLGLGATRVKIGEI